MKTRKYYYEDPLMKTFTAVVLDCQPAVDGWAIELDATAFYPEGGGQACDTGTLNNLQVSEVVEMGDRIWHICNGPLSAGVTVHGCIDWENRFDLMQQHTGEHMVSGIVCSRYGCSNVGFHLGADVIQIDFDAQIPPEDLPQLEQAVNCAIWQDLPVECFVPAEEELPQVFYRTKRPLPWPVRIVRIPGVDSCACCGVHTLTTGQVGLVKLLSCVKFRQGVRMELVCGSRAMALLSQSYEQNRQISRILSARPEATASAVQHLTEQLAEEKFCTAALRNQLLDTIARRYAGQHHVLHFAPGLQSAQVRQLAERIAAHCTGVAVVCAGEDASWQLCLARPGGDVSELGQKLRQALGVRGGGRDGFFQGTFPGEKAALETFFLQQWQLS